MILLRILVAAVVVVSIAVGAEIGQLTCGKNYQDALNAAVSLKEDCENAAFYDCCQAKSVISSVQSGYYEISNVCDKGPFGISSKMFAMCDMETDGGGWIVIQRRVPNGTINFLNQNWEEYEDGFGDLETEFWYGLKYIHCLTAREGVELRIEMKQDNGDGITWVYQQFKVDGPDQKYRLHIGEGEGTEGSTDAMAYHNNQYFSTWDRDNDLHNSYNCARYAGGWWYYACNRANLNGPHVNSSHPAHRISWHNSNTNTWTPYSHTEMKVRPKACSAIEQCQ